MRVFLLSLALTAAHAADHISSFHTYYAPAHSTTDSSNQTLSAHVIDTPFCLMLNQRTATTKMATGDDVNSRLIEQNDDHGGLYAMEIVASLAHCGVEDQLSGAQAMGSESNTHKTAADAVFAAGADIHVTAVSMNLFPTCFDAAGSVIPYTDINTFTVKLKQGQTHMSLVSSTKTTVALEDYLLDNADVSYGAHRTVLMEELFLTCDHSASCVVHDATTAFYDTAPAGGENPRAATDVDLSSAASPTIATFEVTINADGALNCFVDSAAVRKIDRTATNEVTGGQATTTLQIYEGLNSIVMSRVSTGTGDVLASLSVPMRPHTLVTRVSSSPDVFMGVFRSGQSGAAGVDFKLSLGGYNFAAAVPCKFLGTKLTLPYHSITDASGARLTSTTWSALSAFESLMLKMGVGLLSANKNAIFTDHFAGTASISEWLTCEALPFSGISSAVDGTFETIYKYHRQGQFVTTNTANTTSMVDSVAEVIPYLRRQLLPELRAVSVALKCDCYNPAR